MPAIVFGSPEAKAILEKDKEAARLAKEKEEQEAKENNPEWLDQRITEIDDEISAMAHEIAHLQMQRDYFSEKRSRRK